MLGSAIVRRLRSEWTLIPLGLTHAADSRMKVDLLNGGAMADIDAMEWDAVINCAAYRSPDFCEQERGQAAILNARVPRDLAVLAQQRRARMIHISTDYVFPGTNPPYREDDPPARSIIMGRPSSTPSAVFWRLAPMRW